MNFRSVIIAMGACLLSAPTLAADETWSVSEGSDGARRAIWHVNTERGRIVGHASMIERNGQKITFGLAGSRSGDEVTLQRVQASDGSQCWYRGRVMRDGSGGGSVMCGKYRSTWTAARQ